MQSPIFSPIRILKQMNTPTVLILNIDCLVLMGSIVNFNKINFILLSHSFIIILHGALGMPLFYTIRCSVCYLFGPAALSFASPSDCLEPPHSRSITWTSTPRHSLVYMLLYVYIIFVFSQNYCFVLFPSIPAACL